MTLIRSLLAIIAGLLIISFITEGIEFGIVTSIIEGIPSPQDAESYFAVRNQPSILILKLIYTAIASIIGGYLTSWIAKEAYKHTIVLASLQTIALIYGMTSTEFSSYTPNWIWVMLIGICFVFIMLGGYLYQSRRSPILTNN